MQRYGVSLTSARLGAIFNTTFFVNGTRSALLEPELSSVIGLILLNLHPSASTTAAGSAQGLFFRLVRLKKLYIIITLYKKMGNDILVGYTAVN